MPHEISKEEMAGGIRRLYASILIDAVQCIARETNLPLRQRTRAGREQVLIAKHWVQDGNVGVVTFNDVATELDLDPVLLRKRINEVDFDTAAKVLRRQFVGSRYAARKRLETMNDIDVATENERRLRDAQPVLPATTELRVTGI